MPTNPPAAARRDQIRDIINQQGFARVADLSQRFDVTEVTVRADLDSLAIAGAVQRVHGGAVAGTDSSSRELAFDESLLAAGNEKRHIGTTAASLVENGQVIVLDVGTTTTAIARALIARSDLVDVTIVTSALNIAVLLEPAIPRFTVIVTGGTLRPLQHSLVDPLASAVLDKISADVAFIGCSGVDVSAGITNVNLPEADIKRRMIDAAARVIVVADSTKLGVRHQSRVAQLSDVDALITGPEADTAAIEAAGLLCLPTSK
jgi:DeoR family transcriptional regulator of aga operon